MFLGKTNPNSSLLECKELLLDGILEPTVSANGSNIHLSHVTSAMKEWLPCGWFMTRSFSMVCSCSVCGTECTTTQNIAKYPNHYTRNHCIYIQVESSAYNRTKSNQALQSVSTNSDIMGLRSPAGRNRPLEQENMIKNRALFLFRFNIGDRGHWDMGLRGIRYFRIVLTLSD